MADIELRLGNDVLVVQGALESMLAADGFEGCLPFLNLIEPETIEELHRRYRAAGADCAVTNTACASRSHLAGHGLAAHLTAINVEGVRIARGVGFPHVLAAMAPAGLPVEPGSGRAALHARQANASEALTSSPAPGYAAAVDEYAEQARALASAAPDALLLTSFTSVDDALAAIEGIRRATDLPILACISCVSVAPGDTGPFVPDPTQVAQAFGQAGVAALGCNDMDIPATLAALELMRATTSLPLVAFPHAGTPAKIADKTQAYPLGPDDFANACLPLLRAGARVVGSGLGSTPSCTGAIFAMIGGVALPEA